MSKTREFLDNLTHEQLLDRLSLALDGGGLGIWDWDLRDDSVQFDRRWCEMLGLDHATTPMVLDTWRTRVHPDDLARCYADIDAHRSGAAAGYENVHRMRHADGRWIYILDRGRISGRDPNGQPIRFTGTHYDVTATEHARRDTARQRRQLEDLIAGLPSGVAMFDRALRLLAASPRWLRDHQLAGASDPIGRPFAEIAPALAARWSPVLTAAIAGSPTGSDEEAIDDGVAPRGWMRWDARPWRNPAGEIGGALFCTEDVTDRVQRRREAEHARESRLASLAIFAGGVAHELNTPLQVISLEAEMLGRELAKPAPRVASLRDSATAIATTVRRAGAITHALRTLSRDARHDATAAVAVAAILADAEALCRSRFESSGVALAIDDHTAGGMMEARAAEILVILLNLLNNAAHAAAAGAPWIRLGVAQRGPAIAFRCVDGGPGIAPDDAARLMEPFFTTKPAGVGTGLGLAIAHTLAARNGGSLRHVAGEAHTTFELVVPVADAPGATT